MKFIVYKQRCVYCDLAKGYLINIRYYDVLDYRDITKLSGIYPHGVKFPQIYKVDNNNNRSHIGGYTELKEYLLPNFNYKRLKEVSDKLTINLNNIMIILLPIPETKNSNLRHRPIGIGVQGLANVFMNLEYHLIVES